MKTIPEHFFAMLMLGGLALPGAAAVVPPEDFLTAYMLPGLNHSPHCNPKARGEAAAPQNSATPTELIMRYEKALQRNPEDEQALQQLHFIIARAQAGSREESMRLKQVIRKYTCRAVAVLAPPEEPGEPLEVSGTVRSEAGAPIAGALIHVFHADAKGAYSPSRAMDEPNARLFGFMKTGVDGRYEFRTIRPGGYPLQPIPQHIHMLVTAEGFRDHACRATCQLVFDDDPRMTPKWQEWAKAGGNPVLHVTRDSQGVQRGEYEIVLLKD